MRRVLLIGALAATLLWSGGVTAQQLAWCYQVRRGDTLSDIARRYGATVREFTRLNQLDPKSLLVVGQVLALPVFARLREGTLTLDSRPLAARAGNLQRENAQADRQRLSRIHNLDMLQRFVRAGLLVPIPERTSSYWTSGIPESLRVARPWTKRFIEQLAGGFYGIFGGRLKITSLTRTVFVQRSLQAWNHNAAPARGESRSSHLTGASIDISKQPLSTPEIHWLRQVLGRLGQQRVLRAIEEFSQPHFHVMVFREYLAYSPRIPSPLLIGGC